ncbi:MAG: glycosyltransferase family 4 protein [Proteobacteria bacterium]|nr:glycosyltransferase family 4 protein [Pseudomonadota bacterium]MBU4297824.1 glycosyltransferase family 4 protein [Pseudomonadota bacterium]MCG2748654.1 glycosyltransferase family 4 protein [Desulfobulbaceae bacterium]
MFAFFLIVSSLALSYLLNSFFRRYALKAGLLDIPNNRSSHSEPTPKGGGIAIVAVFCLALLFLAGTDQVSHPLFLAAFVGGLLVGVTGFANDRKHIPAGWRLLIHLAAAMWLFFWLEDSGRLFSSSSLADIGIILVSGSIVIGTVWMLNLFNFMDGIDGLASCEAIFMAVSGAVLVSLNGGSSIAILLLVLAACCLGFLALNWPPAKLFLGDAGSGFLGYILTVLALFSVEKGMVNIWSWIILAGIFIVDATVTLLVRVHRGERFYVAHRSHVYQILARRFNSHGKVTVGVIFVNIFWLLPMAVMASFLPQYAFLFVIAGYMPIIVAAVKIGAGIDR